MRISDWSSDVCSSDLAVKSGTPVGLKAKAVMEAGQLVSDEIVSGIIGDRLDELGQDTGVIFDGYPRTAAQAERSEEHTSELQSLMRISSAVFCLKKKNIHHDIET